MNTYLPLVSLASLVCLVGFAAHVPQVPASETAPGKIVVEDIPENVLTEADGTPLAGARVYPVYMTDPTGGPYGDGGVRSRSVLSPIVADAAGKFRMPDGPTNFVNHFIVLPPASANKPGEAPAPFFATVSKESFARIVRPKSVPLTVQFSDSSGKPLADKEVMVFPALPLAAIRAKTETANRMRAVLPAESLAFVVDAGFPNAPPELKAALTARTDASGTAHFAALPQNERVSLTIDALPGHRPLVLAGSVVLTPTPAPVLTVHLPLNGVIAGQVLHRTTNRAVAGARVILYEPGAQGGVRALGPKTDAEGRFRFTSLYPADYQLGFDGLDSPGEIRYQQDEPTKVTLTGESGGLTAQKNVFVIKAARVEVTVRDAGGRPAFAQQVMLNRKTSGGGGLTGIDGKITIFDLPGERELVWTRSGETAKKGDTVRKSVTLLEGETSSVTLGPLSAKGDLRALAPDFVGWDAAGKPVTLSAFRNKVVVLDFTYLAAPSEAMQAAEAAARELSAAEQERVVFLTVGTSNYADAEQPGWIVEKQNQYKAQFPHLRLIVDRWEGRESAQTAYRINGWPHRFVIGPDRTLRASYGSSSYGADGSNYVSISDTKHLLADIRAALEH